MNDRARDEQSVVSGWRRRHGDARHVTCMSSPTRRISSFRRGQHFELKAYRSSAAGFHCEIYGYLSTVYGLVAWWSAEGRETDRARRALRLEVSDREDPF